jgi:hypothetical protein
MVDVNSVYAGQFLVASELAPLGQRRTAVVHAVAMEVIGQEARQLLVLDLVTAAGRAWPKRVVLNKGNALALAAALGPNTDSWPGKPVEIWAENVMFKGQLVPGVKVVPAPPAPAAAVPAAPPPVIQIGSSAVPVPPAAAAARGGPQWAVSGTDLDDEIPF